MVYCRRPVSRHVIGDLSGGASTTSSILISESRVELAWANDVVDVTRDLSIGGSSTTDVTLHVKAGILCRDTKLDRNASASTSCGC